MQANDISHDQMEADLALIRDAAREGGEIAMRYFRKNPETWLKDGTSPVSVADLAVDRFLSETLRAARPDYGWLSEETTDNFDRLSAPRTFVVDPIDGTRAYLDGQSIWCVSIAVVENGASLAGVLDCPALGEIYQATRHGPATLNGKVIRVAPAHDEPRVAGPQAMLAQAPAYMRAGKAVRYIPSLAYRIAMVASGEIDATFVKANAHDWDLAAADLILQRAGGGILDDAGVAPYYAGTRPRHGALVAGSGDLLRAMAGVIAARH